MRKPQNRKKPKSNRNHEVDLKSPLRAGVGHCNRDDEGGTGSWSGTMQKNFLGRSVPSPGTKPAS